MNSTTYFPNPKLIKDLFKSSRRPLLNEQNSMIELVTPIQAVVNRAKSELERINRPATANPVITAADFPNRKFKVKRHPKKRICRKKTTTITVVPEKKANAPIQKGKNYQKQTGKEKDTKSKASSRI